MTGSGRDDPYGLWAARQLGVSPDTTADEARAAFLRLLPREDFVPQPSLARAARCLGVGGSAAGVDPAAEAEVTREREEALRAVLKTGAVQRLELPFLRRDGTMTRFVVHLSSMRDRSGDTSSAVVVMTDITGDHYAHVAVSDTGTGIKPALLATLFEPLVTTKSHGMGLGLSISRAIVEAHGGKIWAVNNAGRGATVHAIFPLLREAAVAAQ